jgi:hypothetical protein
MAHCFLAFGPDKNVTIGRPSPKSRDRASSATLAPMNFPLTLAIERKENHGHFVNFLE